MTIERQNLAINGTPEFKEITLSGAEPLKAKTNQSLTMFADVTGTISLGGVGATLAVTTLSVTTVEATAMDGGLDITIANGVNDVPLNVVNNSSNTESLVITGSSTGNKLVIDTDSMVVTGNTGFWGQGTTNPDTNIEIRDTGANNFTTAFKVDCVNTTRAAYTQSSIELYTANSSGIDRKVRIASELIGSQLGTDMVFEVMKPTAILHVGMRINSDGTINIPNLTASSDVQTDASSNLITVSDSKAKNFKGDVTNAINTILKLKPVKYTYKHEDKENIGKTKIGFFADEVFNILKEGATLNPITNLYGLNSQAILGTLVQAFKDHIANSHYDN